MKKISVDLLASLAGEFLLYFFALLFGILTARFLGATGKGQFGVIFNAAGLTAMVFSLRFERSLTYFLPKDKELLGEVILYGMVVGLFANLCLYLFGILVYGFLYQVVLKGIVLNLSVLVLISFSSYLWSFNNYLLAGLLLFRPRAAFMGISYLIKSIEVVLCLGVLKFGLEELLLVMGVLETLIYLAILLFLYLQSEVKRFRLATFKEMLKYSVALFPGIVSDLVTLRIDVFFLNYFSGAAQVGVYTVAVSMANVLLYVPTAIKNVLKSYVARNAEEDITPKLTRLLIVGMTLICAFLIPFVVFLVIPILYGEQFLASRLLFVILVPGTIFWGVHTILLSDLEGRGFPIKVSVISVLTGILTVLLDWALIPIWNAAGAALVSTITYGFGLLLAIAFYQKIVGVKLKNLIIPTFTDLTFFPRLFISSIMLVKSRSEKLEI